MSSGKPREATVDGNRFKDEEWNKKTIRKWEEKDNDDLRNDLIHQN